MQELFKQIQPAVGKSCGQSQSWNENAVTTPQAGFPEFPFQAEITVSVSGDKCGGVIVNQWFVLTHATCCPAASVQVNLAGGGTTVNPYQSFVKEKLCLVQLDAPLQFTDYHVQPVCIRYYCTFIGNKALAVQYLNSAETKSYQDVEPDNYCETNLVSYVTAKEVCSSPVDSLNDPYPPQTVGQPLVLYEQGYFELAGVYSSPNPRPSGGPYDATGYASICKEQDWFHLNAFCGSSFYDDPTPWTLGIFNGQNAQYDQLPFYVIVKAADDFTGGGAIVGKRHVITSSQIGGNMVQLAFDLGIGDDPHNNFNSIPVARRKTIVSHQHIGVFTLLTVDSDFPFINADGSMNRHVQPICIPTDCGFPGAQPAVSSVVQSAGTGRIGEGQGFPDTLQIGNIAVQQLSTCQTQGSQDISETYFCGISNACHNDQGNPVFIQQGGKFFLISVAYYAGDQCDDGK